MLAYSNNKVGLNKLAKGNQHSLDTELITISCFLPADALRLPVDLPVEVVPLWNQRKAFCAEALLSDVDLRMIANLCTDAFY